MQKLTKDEVHPKIIQALLGADTDITIEDALKMK